MFPTPILAGDVNVDQPQPGFLCLPGPIYPIPRLDAYTQSFRYWSTSMPMDLPRTTSRIYLEYLGLKTIMGMFLRRHGSVALASTVSLQRSYRFLHRLDDALRAQ